jgi:hypothetical protein
MQGGLALLQGSALLVTGALAQWFSLHLVVGLWSLGGVLLMTLLSARWPSAHLFDQATAAAHAANGRTPVGSQPAAPRLPNQGGTAPVAIHQPGTMET